MPLFNRGNKNNSTPTPSTREVGVAGEVMFTGFEKEEQRLDKISIKEYRDMVDKDPTVEALFNVFTMPILASTYKIHADENDTGEAQADKIRQNLLEPPHKGGMELPFSLFLDQLLLSVIDGFQVWERVYYIDKDRKLVLKKLAHRDSIGITLIRSDDGGYGGARQQVTYGNRVIDVTLEPHNTFLFTHNKARSFLYGRSALTSLRKPYIKKSKLEYLDSIALQSDAIKPKILQRVANAVTAATDDQNIVSKTLSALAKLGEIKPVASIPEGYEVKELSAEGRDPHQSIERQNSEMARAFLAPFLLLGSQGSSSVGSYALSADQSDMFMIAIKGFMTKIEEHINQYLIADLIDINYPENKRFYPEFKFDDLTSDAVEAIQAAFTQLISKDRVSDEMAEGIETAMANRLEIDLDKIKKDRKKREEKDAKDAAKKNPPTPPTPPASGSTPPTPPNPDNKGGSAGNGSNFLSDGSMWHRDLTPAENMVKFAEINSKMDSFELQFVTSMQQITDKFTADIIDQALAAKNISDFTVEFPAEYRKTILATIKNAYNYAKTGAADELKVAAPATSKDASDGMQELANFVVDKQQDDLKNLIKSELLKAGRTRNLAEGDNQDQQNPQDTPPPPPEFKDALSVLLGAWFVDKLAKTGASIVSQSINYGRNDVFEDVAQDGDVFQFSGLLDDKICNICRPLDGKTVDRAEYKRTGWKPPIHFHCRCLWILIRKVAKDYKLPDITGIPNESGGYSAPLI